MGNSLLMPVGAVENAAAAFSKDPVGAVSASTGPAASTGSASRHHARRRQRRDRTSPFIQPAEADRGEGQRPPSIGHFLERNVFVVQDFGQEDGRSAPRDV